MSPISFETVLRKPLKTIPKNSKQIFLFKVISIDTLVGAIFQPMHCSQKISNRNSLQFRRYRNFECRYFGSAKWLGRLKSREYGGWLSLLPEQHVVLLSTYAAQMVHTVLIFSNNQAEFGE